MPGAGRTLWCPCCPDDFLGKWTGSSSKAAALLRHLTSASKSEIPENASKAHAWFISAVVNMILAQPPVAGEQSMASATLRRPLAHAGRQSLSFSNGSAKLSTLSSTSPTSPTSRVSTFSLSSDENTPWEHFSPVTLAEGVVEHHYTLPCDGPPKILHVTSFEKKRSNHAVLCCPGCYECREGPSCLYNHLASELPQKGYMVVQLSYRPPADDEEEAAEDVMSCIDWLAEKNHQRRLDSLILVGWSMGSAAVIEAAYLRRHLPFISGIVTLAAQTSGTRNVKHLQVPILALHGLEDQVLPPDCSKTLVQRAADGVKRLVDEDLQEDESTIEMHLQDWIADSPPLMSIIGPLLAKPGPEAREAVRGELEKFAGSERAPVPFGSHGRGGDSTAKSKKKKAKKAMDPVSDGPAYDLYNEDIPMDVFMNCEDHTRRTSEGVPVLDLLSSDEDELTQL
eukprot:symbB.v1.2.010680.t1/scaffold704.1/size171252/6